MSTLPSTFPALLVSRTESGSSPELTSVSAADLPAGEVLIRVEYSSLNYKDALAIRYGAPVVRAFPMVTGVDLAGIVEESADSRFTVGQAVLVNGYGLGENRWGGHAAYARVPADFVLPVPEPFTTAQATGIGTAGYTAALCLLALEKHGLKPGDGDVLVTGASGGVGSFTITLLAAAGYHVIASTGKESAGDYLRTLGASEILDRKTLSAPGKPLQKERWAAAIDSVGGHTLANVCAGLRYRGAVAACGMAQDLKFPASVAPLILRNISLLGIDSVQTPRADREAAWARLARDLDLTKLDLVAKEITLSETIAAAGQLLAGQIRGRLLVRIPAA